MKLKKIILLNLTLALFSITALAQNASQKKLISLERRPKVEQILADPVNLKPFPGDPLDQVEAIKEQLPTLVVTLEKAFPNGTYAFLGRDMDLIADAVDAFYQSIGQKDRVLRIEFSTPSLKNSTPALITKFLEQRGLETKRTAKKGTMVLIDYTSYSEKGAVDISFPSQARHIFQSAVAELKKKGLSATEILTRFNIATFQPNAEHRVRLNEPLIDDRSTFLADQARALSKSGKIDRMTLLDGDISMAYGSEWNDKFGPITKNAKGDLITTPISIFSLSDRKEVFYSMIKVIRNSTSVATRKEVQKLAAKHGVDFKLQPVQQVKKVKAASVDFEAALLNEIRSKLQQLPILPSEKDYEKAQVNGTGVKLTDNGLKVFEVLAADEAIQADRFLEISLVTLMKLHEENKIGTRDFRRIMAHLLTLKKIENNNFAELVKKHYKQVLPLEIMFGREEARQKYSKLPGVGQENYKSVVEDAGLKLSCRFAYLGN